jgi:GT2 family glycosyltransferase
MDDDAEPRADALERLLASRLARDPSTAALCSAVLGPDGEVDVLHRGFVGRFLRALPADEYRPGTAPRLGFSSYTGLLVRSDVAAAIGAPRAELFTWGDDVEYSLRIRSRGELRLIPESRVVHKSAMGGVSTRRSRFWNRILGVSYPSSPLPDYWKQLHLVRNFTWIRYRYFRPGRGAVAGIAAAYAVKSLLYDERPLRRIPWIFRAAWRGMRDQPLGLSRDEWVRIASGRDR